MIDAHLQTIVQKGTQDEYFGVADTNFDLAKLKEAEQPLELLSVIMSSSTATGGIILQLYPREKERMLTKLKSSHSRRQ